MPDDPIRILTPHHAHAGESSTSPGLQILKHTVTFIISCSGSDSMHNVVSSKKMENGIVVFWLEKDDRKWDSFNFQELIDMNINAANLLKRPTMYQIDPTGHKLQQKK